MPDAPNRIFAIRQQISKLQDEQSEVFERAVSFGMTPEIAKECDERRRKIYALMDELFDICIMRSR